MKKKLLVVGIIVLFLGMSIMPIAGSLPIEKEQSVIPKSCFYGINISGTIGENGWYVSNVLVSFDFPANHTYFRFNNGSWGECLDGSILEAISKPRLSDDSVHLIRNRLCVI